MLPLVPAYVSYVADASYQRRRHLHAGERLAALGMSVFFVAGFSLVFIALGTGATLQIGGGLVMVAFGVAMIAGGLIDMSIWLLDAVPALVRLG